MKTHIWFFVLLVGCAHQRLNCHETCAINGMKCDGMESRGSHVATIAYGRDRNKVLQDSGEQAYQCSVTDDKAYLKQWSDSAYRLSK
jgi:hypothetical protein